MILENDNLEGLLAFFTGIISSEKRDFLVYKIQGLRKDTSLKNNQIELLWKKAQNELESTAISNADLIELENQKGEKHYLSVKRILLNDEQAISVYCPNINNNRFLNLKTEYDLEGCIELYSQLLFPDEYSFQIKQRSYRYISSKTLILNRLDAYLTNDLVLLSPNHQDLLYTPLIDKKLWHFFSINGEAISHNQEVSLVNLGNIAQPISFNLRKIVEVFLLEPEQQIFLANLLNSYDIGIDENYPSHRTEHDVESLNVFRNKLLYELKNSEKNGLTVSEAKLINLAKEYLIAELSKENFTRQAIDLLLENYLKNFNNARLGLKKIIPAMRQIILQTPAFLQAFNGHNDNLQFMAGLIASDMTWNQLFHSLIHNVNFIEAFPKIATTLATLENMTASPVTKFLVISSFFELMHTLSTTSVASPEHQLAKSLLIDNTVIFGLMFVENLGLELGPAGLIFDLGITIHQLISSAEYLRQRYHLHISAWEAIKFDLGFSSEVNEIFKGRELLNMNLQFVNQWCANTGINFEYLLLKVPELEKKLLRISEGEFPVALLNETKNFPWRSIENLDYTYSAVHWRELMSVRLLPLYYRNQYQVKLAPKPFSVFFEPSVSQCREDNIFPSPEKKCHYMLKKSCPPLWDRHSFKCLPKICRTKPSSILNWQILVSTQLDCHIAGTSSPMTGRITIKNELGGLLHNSQNYSNREKKLDLLILFQPEFGDIELTDGPFLKNKEILVLISDSMLAHHILKTETHFLPAQFTFHSNDYVSKVHYQLSHTEFESYVIDYSDSISIYCMPLTADQLPDRVIMLNDSEIVFGKKGPRFFEIDTKQEIKINFNQAYFLVGQFTLNANLVYLEKAISYFSEETIFNLQPDQYFTLYQAVGRFKFLVNNTDFYLDVKIKKMNVAINIKKIEKVFYVLSTIDLRRMQVLRYHDFASTHPGFTILLRQDNDRIILLSTYLANTQMQLILEGNYSVNEQVYHTQFAIEEKSQHCVFYKLSVADFFENIDLIKKIIMDGFTRFQFYSDYSVEQVDYTDDFQLKHKEINYAFDLEYELVAVSGAKVASPFNAETFIDLLTQIPIDLRRFNEIKKINTTCLLITERYLLDISAEVRLLTPQGAIHMGLLPVSIDKSFARAQKHGLSVEEPTYFNNFFLEQPAISCADCLFKLAGLTNLLFSAGYLGIFRNNAIRLANLGFLAMGNLALVYFKPALETFFKPEKLAYSRPTKDYTTYSKKNSLPFNNSASYFFQALPNQLVFIHYLYGMFRKTNKTSSIETSTDMNKTLFRLGKALMEYAKSATENEKHVIKVLTKHLIKLHFLVPCTNTIFKIKDQSQFETLVDFIKQLEKFKAESSKIHKKNRSLIRLNKILRRLDRCLMTTDIKFFQLLVSSIESQIDQLMQRVNEQIQVDQTLTQAQQRWLINRINVLFDNLDYFKQNGKKSFAEVAYFINIILPEAKGLSLFFTKNKSLFLSSNLNFKKLFNFFDTKAASQNNFNSQYPISQNAKIFFKNSSFVLEAAKINQISPHDPAALLL